MKCLTNKWREGAMLLSFLLISCLAGIFTACDDIEDEYITMMSPTDRLAAANVYELAQILSAMEQIKKEQEEANLKIGFINKKKERKAQEEITD